MAVSNKHKAGNHKQLAGRNGADRQHIQAQSLAAEAAGTQQQQRQSLKVKGDAKPPVILVPGLASSRAYGRWCYKVAENACSRMSGHTCVPNPLGVGSCDAECALPDLGGPAPAGATWEQLWASTDPVTLAAEFSICWRNRLEQTFNGTHFQPAHADLQVTAWREPNYDSSGKFVLTDDFGAYCLAGPRIPKPFMRPARSARIRHW